MRWVRSILALALVALLAGCAGLPTSSDVEAEQAISSSPAARPPNVYPNPPYPGESPQEIVSDFLKATSSPEEDFRIARQYLTGTASNTWDPGSHDVIITTSEQDYSVVERYGAPVEARGRALATLDGTGQLTQLSHHKTMKADFHLDKVDGQWRISELPDDFGAWVSLADFNRLYTSHVVYFADTATHTLVPDTRWYLASGGEATALARAVLGSPPAWMDGMAVHGMPSGTRLTVDAVPIDGQGVARVDLSDQALQADSTTRRAIWASMLATLQTLPSVHNVRLTVGGSPLAIGESPGTVTTPEDLSYHLSSRDGGDIILRSGGTLRWHDPMQKVGRPGLIKPEDRGQATLPTVADGWQLLAASQSGKQVAGVSTGRDALGRWVDGDLTVQNFGTHLTKPTFTRFHELWVAGDALSTAGAAQTDGGQSAVWVIDTSIPAKRAQPQIVSVPWLHDAHIVSMKASPEGERMALVVRSSSGDTTLVMCGIVRDDKGTPVALSDPSRQGRAVSEITDVTWVDEATLGVLGITSGSPQRQPVLVPLDGLVSAMGPAQGAHRLVAAGTGASEVFVITDQRTVLERSGRGWQTYGGSSVIVPGT